MNSQKKVTKKAETRYRETRYRVNPPTRYQFQNFDFETKCWWANGESGERTPRRNAPCVIYYDEPYSYAIVFYRDPVTNKIKQIEDMSLSEAYAIQTKYELALMAEIGVEN
jgi:hypothetical protein